MYQMYLDDYSCPITANVTAQGYRAVDTLADDVNHAISLFSEENQFVAFDAAFSAEEVAMFENLKMDHEMDRAFFRSLSVSRETEVLDFADLFKNDLMKFGNDIQVAYEATNSITRFIWSLLKETGCDKMKVMYRSHHISADFWHFDDSASDHIILMTLKGDGTLFCKLAGDEQTRLHKIKNHKKNLFLGNFSKIEEGCDASQGDEIFQAQPLQPTVIKTSLRPYSTKHASPILEKNRFFINFVPVYTQSESKY
jgi:hypothetical protein